MSTQTVLPQPTLRGSSLSTTDYKWLLLAQSHLPLVTVDTTHGDVVMALPGAGVEASGQTNQNVEIIYRKISSDAHIVTITGSEDGPQTLTTKEGATSRVRFKSDGTNWWVVG